MVIYCYHYREALLHTLLQITVDVFANAQIVGALADTLLDTVFFIWIKTGRNTTEMWSALQQKIPTLFAFIQPIKQIKVNFLLCILMNFN